MFNFRLIDTADGNQIIDRNLKTPYEALTPIQMMEYMEVDDKIAKMESIERKAKNRVTKKHKKLHSPLYRLVGAMGLL